MTVKKWWLFTTNVLYFHKKLYDTQTQAEEKLSRIIASSTQYYKLQLERDAKKEILKNEGILNPKKHRFKFQKRLKEFKRFDKDELGSSIKLLCVDISDKNIKEIFREG